MTAAVLAADVDRFRAVVARRFGLQFDESKGGLLGEVLQQRMDAHKLSADSYLARLEADTGNGESRVLAGALTVPETYFFRHFSQFRALVEAVLPVRMRARDRARRLRILSAGCASGEEAYTLAMLAREAAPDPRWDITVRGVDLNPAALTRTANGRFTRWSLRETPPELEQRWFRSEGKDVILDEEVRAAVTLEERNLTEDDPNFWRPDSYDVVFCRNVIMYLTADAAEKLVARIAHALAPGGYLFLGHAETLRGLSQQFHLVHTHDTFYYQRKPSLTETRLADVEPWRSGINGTPRAPSTDSSASWIENVQRAADRIKALTEGENGKASSPSSSAVPPGRRSIDLGFVIELLRQERFAEALQHLERVTADAANDPEALLLRAVLLTHSGQLPAAEVCCRKLLALDELSAGAQYLLALCSEARGDVRGAADHNQTAVYLDPAFAMPHLHLGLLARRTGERDVAERELRRALLLFQSEEASRVLLFGGGFSRDGLIELCRAEVDRLGSRA